MTHATFYILDDKQDDTDRNFQWHFACRCAAMSYRQGYEFTYLQQTNNKQNK